MSRLTHKTDELLIDPSKTQRLNILEEEYLIKEQALEKATDLISLLSDELESMKELSQKTIDELQRQVDEYQEKNHYLEKRIREIEELISHKESRIVGVPPLSKRTMNSEKKSSKSRIREQASSYSSFHTDFLKTLASTLLTKIFQTHKQAEYLFEFQSQQLSEFKNKMASYRIQYQEIQDWTPYSPSLKTKQQLFEIIDQQQQIINNLKSYICNIQTVFQPLKQQNLNQTTDGAVNLISELKMILEIIAKSMKTRTLKTRQTEEKTTKYRGRETQSPFQYPDMQTLVSRERYLMAENKELKNIIEGLIAHMKR